MKPVPENYPHEECAGDLERGANLFGTPGEPDLEPVLDKGGVVILPCPSCTHEGRPHFLSVQKKNGRYRVSPSKDAA
jgi:hypothetical protein